VKRFVNSLSIHNMVYSKIKKSKSKKQNSSKVKVGGVIGCYGDRSSKRDTKNIGKKKKGCGCGSNKKRTHKAQKGGAVRTGTVVQNMPLKH
jgi:hypothetical protein